MAEIKAIETRYKGYRFRSRLEARWAVCFDAAGIEWQYEPEGFDLPSGWYLPDFWIPAPLASYGPLSGYWVEIKPKVCGDDLRLFDRSSELTDLTKHTSHVLLGDPGDFIHLVHHHKNPGWAMSMCDEGCALPKPIRGKPGFADPDEYGDPDPGFFLWVFLACMGHQQCGGWNNCSGNQAITAARSARFEFGESGGDPSRDAAIRALAGEP